MRPQIYVSLALYLCLSSWCGAVTYRCKDAHGNWTEAACTGAAAPPETSKKPRSRYLSLQWCLTGPASPGIADACLDIYRPELLDSRGAYVVTAQIAQKDEERVVVIEGRAVNRLGGPIPLHIACLLTPEDTIDSEGTKEFLEQWDALQTLRVGHLPLVQAFDCGL